MTSNICDYDKNGEDVGVREMVWCLVDGTRRQLTIWLSRHRRCSPAAAAAVRWQSDVITEINFLAYPLIYYTQRFRLHSLLHCGCVGVVY